jgi:5'(3')-deoxyribonucleotidase
MGSFGSEVDFVRARRNVRIGIDSDGCVFDFVGNLRDFLVTHHGRDPAHLPPAQCWDFYKGALDDGGWGMTSEEFLRYCHEGVDAGFIFRTGEPIPGAIEALEELRSLGHTIHIVTNRHFGTKSIQNTEDWYRERKIPFDSMTFAKDKTIVRTDVFLDDFTDNYDQLQNAGLHPVFFDQPWNRHHSGRRVFSWDEFVAYVKIREEILGLRKKVLGRV